MIVKFDSMFVVKGQGVILSGEVEEGEISIGQKVTLTSPQFGVDIRVKGLEIERKIKSKAKQGQHVAVMFDDKKLSELVAEYEKAPKDVAFELNGLKAVNCEKPWWKFW